MIVVKDDDEPLSGSDKPKGSAKKARTYTEAEKAAIKEQCDRFHSDCRQLQYEKEFESFKVYRKTIKKLRAAPNTDDHTTYICDYVLKEQAQSYSCAGNLMTARAFLKKIRAECNDAEKIEKADKMLREKGLPGVPDESMVDGKREKCLARYVMQVLQNKAGVVVDSHHADWGRDQNIGLYDIISPMSMTKIERSGTTRFQGKSLPAKVGHGYCPMCPYASSNHRTLNNHVRLHFRMSMVCGYPDCWEVLHNADLMWRHARTHGFSVAEPCAPPAKKK